ncbi:MAG: membrane dipeptidase [Thermoanaerobacteraceae bacterium]|jgi:membrane dipeptidase|nr:membrane dipeptidase [Thermoanaerobacteraceae bacterium]
MQKKIQERIKNIHKNFTIVDAHLDLLFDIERKRRRGQNKVIETEYLPKLKDGGINIIVSSIYIDGDFLPELALRKALDQISALYSELDESQDKIIFVKNTTDMDKALKEDKIGILLSFEGVEPLINDINLLRIFYELGVRGVGITWSRRNFAADGCSFGQVKDRENGLSDFGRQIVKEAERLGMFIDVSHLNDAGFWDVMEITTQAVIASHSNCRALNEIMRNLTDDQIKALAKTGGVIGINAVSTIVAEHNADIRALADHVDHLREVAGIRHVGLGFDFCDEIFGNPFSDDKNQDDPYDVIQGHQNIYQLTEELIKRGYTDDELRLIYGENFLRVYKGTLK